MDLTGTTALVTGASSGLGEEFAAQLADRSVDLVLVARRKGRLDMVRSVLLGRHPGLRIEVIVADLSVPGAGLEIHRQLRDLGISIDVLINNAGAGTHGAFLDAPPDQVADQIQLNCGALADLTSRLLPSMIRSGHGLVVNIASTAAFQPIPTMAVYGATKAFVLSFTEALWWETRGSGVRVLTLCPGPTETGFFLAAGEQFKTRGRGTPREVVRAAFASLDTAAVTVVPGILNRLTALGYRVMPRRLMLRVAQRSVAPSTT